MIACLWLADDLTLFSRTREGMQRKLKKLWEFCAKLRLKLSTEKTVLMVFDLQKRPYEPLEIGGHSFVEVEQYSFNGFVVNNDFKWQPSVRAHFELQLKKASCIVGKLAAMRKQMGNLPPAQFYNLYKTIVKPDFVYAAEACIPYLHEATLKEMEALQINFARASLGIAGTNSSVLLTLLDLGQMPLPQRLILLTLQFLPYALSLPCNCFIKRTVVESIRHSKDFKSGWFWDLKTCLGESLKEVILPLEDDNPNWEAIQDALWMLSIPGRYKELPTVSLQIELTSRMLASSKFQFYAKNDLISVYQHTANAFARQLYTTLLLEVSRWVARLRLGCHHLRVERGQHRGEDRTQHECWLHHKVEDKWHALMSCTWVTKEREALWEELGRDLTLRDNKKEMFRALVEPRGEMSMSCATFVAKTLRKAWKRDLGNILRG